MKTTLELSDRLLAKAKRLAAREGTTLRALVEAGLEHVVASRAEHADFRLADARVDGCGLSTEFADGSWDHIRGAIYGDER